VSELPATGQAGNQGWVVSLVGLLAAAGAALLCAGLFRAYRLSR